MLTRAAPKMLLLLIKSDVKNPGKFAHSGKHYLLNGRWHALHHDKPVPKGAAVAAHPHAAGAPVAGGVFSDDEWKQVVSQFKLDIDPSNSNASDVIKKLNALKHMADTGDVTGILGSTYGTNSYSKNKIVPLANYILGKLGSTHKVAAGQKAGTHEAVQGAPEAAPLPSAEATPLSSPASAPAAEEGPKEGDTKQGANGELVFKQGRWHKYVAADEHGELPPALVPVHDNPEDAAPEQPATTAAALSMPAFQEGKTVSGVVDYYEKVGQHVLDLAAAGDVAGLEAMKADGLKPNSKGKVSNTWAGKTPNSKILLALHAQALEHAKGGKPAESAKDDAIQAAVDHLKEDAQQGDLPAAEKKEDAALVQKLEAAQGKPAEQFEVSPSGYLVGKNGYVQQYANIKQAKMKAEQMKAAGYDVHVSAFHPFKIVVNSKPGENQNPIKNEDAGAATVSEQPAAPEQAPIKKEPRLVIPKKQAAAVQESKPEPAATTVPAVGTDSNVIAPASKLDAIPWDAQLLPAENKNAKSHNKQVEKIKAMAMAGDIAGLEAFKAGSNTYGKKQNLLAQTALAALKESTQEAATDKYALTPEAKEVIDTLGENAQHGGIDGLKHVIAANPAGSGLHEYAKQKLSEVQKPAATETSDNLIMLGIAKLKADQKISQDGKDVLEAHLKANPGDLVGAAKQAEAYGYHHTHDAAMQLAAELSGMSQPDAGPKEGDTKQGADGMLVFKNGRWHKVEEQKTAEPAPAEAEPAKPATVKKLSASEVIALGKGFKTAAGNKAKIKALAVAGDMEGLKQFIDHLSGKMPASKKLAEKVLEAMEAAPEVPVSAPKKASKPKAAAAPQSAPAAAPAIEPMDAWAQTGPQGGSNPGGRFKDANGEEWYCKFPADEDTAKAEVLAAKLYAALGISGQDAKLITKGGKVGIASKWTSVSKASAATLAKTDGVAAGFGADAWLGNWDVVGLGFDNLQIGADGKAHRVDAGGSLMYRAQGGKKAFGNIVTEIDSLRDPKINPQAAAVFGGMTEADITASVAKVINLPDASIRAICFQHGPGDEAARKALADTLIARKEDLAAKFPKAAKAKKKRLDQNNLPVDATQLPKRHDFSNWNGPGKGLSSQAHVNAANNAVEHELIELAKTGNLNKLKDFHFHEIDKTTGTATGKMLPIKNHPSKHVVQFHADLVQLLDEIANPPEPLKHFVEAEVGTLDALSAAFPPKPFGTTVDSVKSNEKLGFWVVLGGAAGADKFKPKKVMDFTKAAIDAAYQKYQEAKPLAKHFINSVQASGSYNDLFRNGKEFDGHGNKLSDVAKAALENATSQPEGTSVYRWQNMSDDMVKKIMGAPDGTVFQATGPMCTSYSPTATAGFGQHRVTIRYAAGAKGVESFGSGAFKGEKEVTTLPNSRFVILSKKMVPNEKYPGKQRLELEVLMLPPDLGIANATQ